MKKYLSALAVIVISVTSFKAPLTPRPSLTKHAAVAGKDYAFVIFYKIQGAAYVSTIFCYNQSNFPNTSAKSIEYALVAWARNAVMDGTGNTDVAKMNEQFYTTNDLAYPVNKLDKFNGERTNAIASAKMRYNPVTIVNVATCYVKEK